MPQPLVSGPPALAPVGSPRGVADPVRQLESAPKEVPAILPVLTPASAVVAGVLPQRPAPPNVPVQVLVQVLPPPNNPAETGTAGAGAAPLAATPPPAGADVAKLLLAA